MKRLLPSFDETALGCLNFSEFLARCPDVVTVIDNLSGGHVAMATEAPSQDAAGPAERLRTWRNLPRQGGEDAKRTRAGGWEEVANQDGNGWGARSARKPGARQVRVTVRRREFT